MNLYGHCGHVVIESIFYCVGSLCVLSLKKIGTKDVSLCSTGEETEAPRVKYFVIHLIITRIWIQNHLYLTSKSRLIPTLP